MASEFETRMIDDFTGQIAIKLDAAAGIARVASGLGSQGLSKQAFRMLLDIEPLISDAATLLNAASVVRRREDNDD